MTTITAPSSSTSFSYPPFLYENKHQVHDATSNTDGILPPMPSSPPPQPPTNEDLLISFDYAPTLSNDAPHLIPASPSWDSSSTSTTSMTPPSSSSSDHTNIYLDASGENDSHFSIQTRDPALDQFIAIQQQQQKQQTQTVEEQVIKNNNSSQAKNYGTHTLKSTIGKQQQQQGQKRLPLTKQERLKIATETGVHPYHKEMKRLRKARTVVGVVGGAVLGGLILGPVGAVLGGAAGGAGLKKVSKSQEKRAQRKFEQRNVQQAALKSGATRGAAFA